MNQEAPKNVVITGGNSGIKYTKMHLSVYFSIIILPSLKLIKIINLLPLTLKR